MSGDSSAVTSTAGARANGAIVLKTLKSPEEGGTKKDYDDFIDKIDSHVSINWEFGQDVAYVIKNTKAPEFVEPEDLTTNERTTQWKVRLWNQKVDRYGLKVATFEDNMGALYSLINDGLSKIMKAKVRGKQGFNKAQEEKDALWMLKTIEDITLNFEETKPKLLAIDDQMERIMKIKQGDTTNEDYIKMMSRELKVYEKHGGDFLWGKTQVRAWAVRSR